MAQSALLFLLWLFGTSLAGFPNQINIGESVRICLPSFIAISVSMSGFDEYAYLHVYTWVKRRRIACCIECTTNTI